MTRDRAGTGYGFLAAWIALHGSGAASPCPRHARGPRRPAREAGRCRPGPAPPHITHLAGQMPSELPPH
jgi:hypothetical protein